MNPRASFVIPTRDRIGELRDLLRSLRAQTVPVEILVMDDSESEVAAAMVTTEFPEVRYFRLGSNRGPAFQRNRGIELASADFVFPVDDDTLFPSPHTVEQTLADFRNASVGAVAIPYINVRQDSIVRQRAPDPSHIYFTGHFVGAAHAVRRELFLRAKGYREAFFYMGEESDLCIRLYAMGAGVCLGNADPIHHLESPIRNFKRADRLGSRNQVIFVWHNVPMPFFVPHLVLTTFNILAHSLLPERLANRGAGVLEAYLSILSGKVRREPVSAMAYRAFRLLSRRSASREEICTAFPDLLRQP